MKQRSILLNGARYNLDGQVIMFRATSFVEEFVISGRQIHTYYISHLATNNWSSFDYVFENEKVILYLDGKEK